MTWALIIVILYNYSPAVHSVGFTSQDLCEKAKQQILSAAPSTSTAPKLYCVQTWDK